MNLKIVKATLLLRYQRADTIYLYTDLPDPTLPPTDNLSLIFYAAIGSGAAYLEAHFPDVPVEVIRFNGVS